MWSYYKLISTSQEIVMLCLFCEYAVDTTNNQRALYHGKSEVENCSFIYYNPQFTERQTK